jgi:hypothetical protein
MITSITKAISTAYERSFTLTALNLLLSREPFREKSHLIGSYGTGGRKAPDSANDLAFFPGVSR